MMKSFSVPAPRAIAPHRFLPTLLLATFLAGCSGGDDEEPPLDIATLGGFWVADDAQAVVQPDGEAWVIRHPVNEAPNLYRFNLTASGPDGFEAVGRVYALPGGVGTDLSLTGTYVSQSGAAPRLDLNGTGFSLSLRADASRPAAASQADLTGSWFGSLDSGSVQIEWTLNQEGAVLGTSSTGCAYAGQVLVAEAGAYSVDVVETCPGSTRTFEGVAALALDKASVAVLYTADADQVAGYLRLARP